MTLSEVGSCCATWYVVYNARRAKLGSKVEGQWQVCGEGSLLTEVSRNSTGRCPKLYDIDRE